jgi:hypothetical protein
LSKGGPKQGKRQRHALEQIIRRLRTAEQMLSEGKTICEAAKALRSPSRPCTGWRNQYSGMKADVAKRLEELEKENRDLQTDRGRPGTRHPRLQGNRQGKL